MNIIYPTLFYKEKEGGFSVFIPDLDNISTCGNTLEEAIKMTQELIAIIILDKLKNKETIPNRSNIENISFKKLEDYLQIEDWDYVSKFKSYILVDLNKFKFLKEGNHE